MGRTNGLRNQPLVLDVGNNNQVLMNTRDFDMGVAPGVRLLTGRRSDVGPGWELGYTGIFNAFADKSFSNGVFSAPGDMAQQLDGWTTADNIRPTYQSLCLLGPDCRFRVGRTVRTGGFQHGGGGRAFAR